MKRKLILYIATSIDGFIAKPNDDLSFLSMVQEEGEDYGYVNFTQSIDTVILGRKTYDWVIKQVGEFPHADKESYVITRTPRPSIGKTHFYTGDLEVLLADLKQQEGKHIYCDGGAEIANELLRKKLIDELIISVVPILLGEGTRLFKEGNPEQVFKLVSAKSFNKGLVQLHYTNGN
jgi:dihydrofolate reductase